MYLFMAVGLGLTVWPSIIAPSDLSAGPKTVIRALLGALGLLALLGIRYPVRMLPLLMFELLWKVIWILAFALPVWLHGELDTYASETLFACMMGVVLVPIVIPWRYVVGQFARATGEPWHVPKDSAATKSVA